LPLEIHRYHHIVPLLEQGGEGIRSAGPPVTFDTWENEILLDESPTRSKPQLVSSWYPTDRIMPIRV
jgi:hypothetical protein